MIHDANAFSLHPLVVSNMVLLGELPEQQDHRKNNHNHNGKNDNNNSLINAHKLSQCLDRMEQSYWMRFHETNTSSDDNGQRLLELYDSQTRSNSARRRINLPDYTTNIVAPTAPFGRNEISHPSFQNDSPHAQKQQQQEQLQNLIVVQDHQGSLQTTTTTTTTNRISSSCSTSSVIFESKNPAGPEEEEPNDKDDEDAPLDDLEQWLDNVIDLK